MIVKWIFLTIVILDSSKWTLGVPWISLHVPLHNLLGLLLYLIWLILHAASWSTVVAPLVVLLLIQLSFAAAAIVIHIPHQFDILLNHIVEVVLAIKGCGLGRIPHFLIENQLVALPYKFGFHIFRLSKIYTFMLYEFVVNVSRQLAHLF